MFDAIDGSFLGGVKSSITAHLGKTKVDLKEASKFVSGYGKQTNKEQLRIQSRSSSCSSSSLSLSSLMFDLEILMGY